MARGSFSYGPFRQFLASATLMTRVLYTTDEL
jgi:hypothetical protein